DVTLLLNRKPEGHTRGRSTPPLLAKTSTLKMTTARKSGCMISSMSKYEIMSGTRSSLIETSSLSLKTVDSALSGAANLGEKNSQASMSSISPSHHLRKLATNSITPNYWKWRALNFLCFVFTAAEGGELMAQDL